MFAEELIIRHCSPTLAGLKTGNIFNCDFHSKEALYSEIRKLNQILVRKGVRVLPLKYQNQRALIYVYRPEMLKQDFHCCEACRILNEQGYSGLNQHQCLMKLIERLNHREEFPHEIGLFLGYPPDDVTGFIQKQECRCVGYWKVYHHEEEARKTFRRYHQCTEIFLRAYQQGKSLDKLVIAN